MRTRPSSNRPSSTNFLAALALLAIDEILDIVDGNDNVIGTATRAAVHSENYRHRAVHILVFDAARRIYLQKRSKSKDNSPGLWDTSAAGHVDSGESYRVAANRELTEELGLPIESDLEELFKLDAKPATGFEFAVVYRHETTLEPIPDPIEIAEGRWIDSDTLNHWLDEHPNDFTETFREIWSIYGSMHTAR
ncbi:MAG: isopentenyl-diphosphate delta-isomerase [Gammaproteobacteria bacterium]|jgi:isopentenyl-diphosphate delta-isomerase